MNSKKNNKSSIKVGKIVYRNPNIGFAITIPDNWLEVKRSSYEDLGISDNTLSVFAVDKFTTLSILFHGFSKAKGFNQFFDKVKFAEQFDVLLTGSEDFDNVLVKYVITRNNDKKIMHNFCLINGMIINFCVNIDIKNKIFDNDDLLKDDNVKTVFTILKNIFVFKPVDPPIYVNDEKEDLLHENETDDSVKKTAILAIETDCKYRHILMPEFYFKYNCDRQDSKVVLNIINDEIYYNDLKDKVRFTKMDENLSLEISRIIAKEWSNLLKMDCGYKKVDSDMTLVIRFREEAVFIDLLDRDNNRDILNSLIDSILNMISKNSDSKVKIKIDEKVKQLKEEKLQSHQEEVVELENDKKKLDTTSEEDEHHDDEKSEEPVEEVVESNTENRDVVDEEVSSEPSEEENSVLLTTPDPNDEEREDEEVPEVENEPFANLQYRQYLHNIDGHASFCFWFPVDSGLKVDREFNVFDIVNNESLEYRVFIFKCETVEKYEQKLYEWIDKNIETSYATLLDCYDEQLDDGMAIKTYVLSNNKFYKVVYKSSYLIAVSSVIDDEKMYCADHALKSVVVGEDDRLYIEAQNRKLNSIAILKEQGIPYIDELPPIESSYEVVGKTMDEIAKRAIVLCICANYASDIVSNKKKRYLKDSKKFFSKLLDRFNVKDCMTKEEKELFETGDKNLAIQISWQFEGYVVLLWVLNLVVELQFPNVLVNPEGVTALVSSCGSYSEFIAKCELRDVKEVLDMADLTYRYDWYCVESHINAEEPIINPEVVMERHRAFKWLLTDEKWDEVELNT